MKITKFVRLAQLALLVAGVAALGGCRDDADPPVGGTPNPPAADPSVPNSAGASSAAFVSYLKTLAADETSEPLPINGDFASPTEDTEEPTAL